MTRMRLSSGGLQSERGKSSLDMILDLVIPRVHEVTMDLDGYTREQVQLVLDAATARGLDACFDGRFCLIRDLR